MEGGINARIFAGLVFKVADRRGFLKKRAERKGPGQFLKKEKAGN